MQTDRLGNSTTGVLSIILYLVAINSILGELRNGVDGLLFADNLAIYVTTKNQRVATTAVEEVTNKLGAWAIEKRITFSPKK